MSIDSNMKMVGKRFPFLATYQVRHLRDNWLSHLVHALLFLYIITNRLDLQKRVF